MAINKVDLTVSQLINDLNEGLTWLKKDDLGYGSIETKYSANEKQIIAIRKHPKLKDAETSLTIFNIIDDTKETNTTTEKNMVRGTIEESRPHMDEMVSKGDEVDSASFSAFANL